MRPCHPTAASPCTVTPRRRKGRSVKYQQGRPIGVASFCFVVGEGEETKIARRMFVALFLWSGKRGIRTPGTVTRTPHFECGPIDHSGIFPIPCRKRSPADSPALTGCKDTNYLQFAPKPIPLNDFFSLSPFRTRSERAEDLSAGRSGRCRRPATAAEWGGGAPAIRGPRRRGWRLRTGAAPKAAV